MCVLNLLNATTLTTSVPVVMFPYDDQLLRTCKELTYEIGVSFLSEDTVQRILRAMRRMCVSRRRTNASRLLD